MTTGPNVAVDVLLGRAVPVFDAAEEQHRKETLSCSVSQWNSTAFKRLLHIPERC